jgi:hypothetical protein
VAGSQGGLAGTDHRFDRGEIRLADFQVDHIVAGCFQGLGPRQQGHHVEGGDVAAARAEAGRIGHRLILTQQPRMTGGKLPALQRMDRTQTYEIPCSPVDGQPDDPACRRRPAGCPGC